MPHNMSLASSSRPSACARTLNSRAQTCSSSSSRVIHRPRARIAVKRRDCDTLPPRAAPEHIIDAIAAVDAWSVTNAASPSVGITLPPGIETKLFQVGLAPYLVYLWFLNASRATPPTSNFGARFLLLFVAATIPAGIIAKTQYGDILANVDVLHGGSESLLTISNALFAYGFGSAVATSSELDDANIDIEDATTTTSSPAIAVLGVLFLACASSTLAIGAAVDGGLLGGVAAGEPSNALSLPTWAVHVSSVTEWALAMKYVAQHGERTGNVAWRNLTLAMSPFLASGLTACTFHAFYNAPSINSLVPLQALLTLLGNCGCALAAYTITSAENDSTTDIRGGVKLKGDRAIDDGIGFALKLALWTTLVSAAVKYGELYEPAAAFFAEPSYSKAIGIIALPSVVWSYYALNTGDDAPKLSMADVKAFGVAGTASYVIIELAFWALALPIAIGWYKVAEGSWLDLTNTADKAKLLGAGAVFINVVRLFVPLRLAAALALAPYVSRALADKNDEPE